MVSHRSIFKSSGLNWSSRNMIGPISVLGGGKKEGEGAGGKLRAGLSCDINRKPRQAFNQRWTRYGERRQPQLQAKEAPSTRSRLTGRRLRQGRTPHPPTYPPPTQPPSGLFKRGEKVSQCIIDTTKGRRLIDQSTAGMYVQDGDGFCCCCCFLRLQTCPTSHLPHPSEPAGEESDTCAALLGSPIEKRAKESLQVFFFIQTF